MKSAAGLAALLAIGIAAHAQTSYEELSTASRKDYDACTDAAASKPTSEGVQIAMSTCNRRFFSAEQSTTPETTESFAKVIAEGINEKATNGPLAPDVLSQSAVALGKLVVIKFKLRSGVWGPDSLAQRKKLEQLAKDACEVFSAIPEFTTGGLSITYIYDDDRGNRLTKMAISQKQCELLQYR